jgi:hypothetical protein
MVMVPPAGRLVKVAEMFTQERARERTGPPTGPSSAQRWRILGHDLPGVLIVCLAGGLVTAFFLLLYHRYTMPIGWDTARYLDQTNLVAKYGLAGVSKVALPRPHQVLTSRVGFPVMVLALSRLFFTSTLKAAAVVPIACVAATALAAGAFVSYSLRRGAWEMAAVSIVVGTSAAMVELIAGAYTDNLIAWAVFAAALIPILAVARDGRGFVAAIVLLGVGGLVHVAFFEFMLGVLALVALLYLPASIWAWRRKETSALATPSARLGMALGGAGAFAAIGIFGALNTKPARPELSRREFGQKLTIFLPVFKFPVTVPVAAVGAASLAAEVSRGRRPGDRLDEESLSRRADRFGPRFFAVLMAAWSAAATAGIVLYYMGRPSPAHRFLGFLMPLPILIALGLLWIARLLSARTTAAAGIAVVLVGIVALGFLSYQGLYVHLASGVEWLDEGKITNAVRAQAYLHASHVPDSQPVVFVIDDGGPNPQVFLPEEAHIMRSVFPADRIRTAYFYVGTPENYLAGRPTILPDDTRRYNIASTRFWNDLQPVYQQHPIALMLDNYNPAFGATAQAHPEWVVNDGVIALNGPRPATKAGTPPIPGAPRGLAASGVYSIAVLVVLTLIGVGWAVALLPAGVRPFEVLAVSAGFGVAFLVIAGTVADRLGLGLAGVPGGLAGPVAGCTGWVLGGRRLLRHGPSLFAT